jgi:hypothetical protein
MKNMMYTKSCQYLSVIINVLKEEKKNIFKSTGVERCEDLSILLKKNQNEIVP